MESEQNSVLSPLLSAVPASAVLFLFNVIETNVLREGLTSKFSHILDPKQTRVRPSSHLACRKIQSIDIDMLVRHSRSKRLRAGWLIALIYLLCVLAPTISYALPGAHSIAPCLTDDNHVPGMVHVHNEMPTTHVHKDGQVHDHAAAHSHASSDGDHHPVSMAMDGSTSAPRKAPHSSDGQCCGLMCVSALPATLVEIAMPSVPTASEEVERHREVADNGPSSHYRPPIA